MTVWTIHYSSCVLLVSTTPPQDEMADPHGNKKKCALLTLILVADSMMYDTECVIANKVAKESADSVVQTCLSTSSQRIGSTNGRKWLVERNEQDWLFRYAMSTDYL